MSEEDAFDTMMEALSRRPAAADDKAEDNIRGARDTTAQKLTDGEPVSSGPSIEEYTPGPADKIADVLGIERKRRYSYERTAVGNADRMVDRFGEGIRYAPEWGQVADVAGQALEQESGRRSGDLRRRHGPRDRPRRRARGRRGVADEGEQKKIAEWAMRSQSLERLKAMWTLAKADLAASPSEFDTDPMLLNVANGTLDLRTGTLKGHDPKDLITKLAPVEYDVTAKSPTFDRFIKQVLVDKELIRFVQRYLGYSLTGSTKERTMPVLHSTGKNGKSTLVELFQDLLGDYLAVAHMDTVMQNRGSDAMVQYQLAELAGARFVGISEPEKGVRLKESTVKQITGNDTISARAPFGRPFGYRPQFKIWMSTNHKPEIPDGSEAIWDRIKLIPFKKRFEGAGADTDLPEKLRKELPGVLAWAVMGCVEWYQHGLGTAAVVEAATAAYRTETDVFERFMSEVCVLGRGKTVTKTDLYEAYEQWCAEEGEEPKTMKTFGTTMKERGAVKNFEDKKSNGICIWTGIGLRESDPDPTLPTQSDPAQKSCKQGGRENPQGQIVSDSEKVFEDGPREEGFSENGHNPTLPTLNAPEVITGPLSWEEDGLEIEYMPEGE